MNVLGIYTVPVTVSQFQKQRLLMTLMVTYKKTIFTSKQAALFRRQIFYAS